MKGGLMLAIEKTSKLTGKRHTMLLPITLEEYGMWKGGQKLLQHAFPQLNADQREFLLTGSTPEEWDSLFRKEEEEDRG